MSETISESRGGNVLQKALRNKRVLNVSFSSWASGT